MTKKKTSVIRTAVAKKAVVEKISEVKEVAAVEKAPEIEKIPENAEALKAEQVPAPLPKAEEELKFNLSSMTTITLENRTRVSFAEGTTYEQGSLNIEAFGLVLAARQKEAKKISK